MLPALESLLNQTYENLEIVLVNDGSFRVIERKKLDTVLAEQDFAQSDRADPSAAGFTSPRAESIA